MSLLMELDVEESSGSYTHAAPLALHVTKLTITPRAAAESVAAAAEGRKRLAVQLW
jgi:hypothetical protein